MNRHTSPVAFSLAVTLSLAVLSGITLVAAFPMPSTAATPAGGIAFSFGNNAMGRTGLGTSVGITTIATPIDTTNLGDRSIKQAAAGSDHSLLLADDGTVFSFGRNDFGKTGVRPEHGSILVPSPIDTRFLEGRSIIHVAAGENHSLLLADDGTVFSCGYNGRGQTGRDYDIFADDSPASPIDRANLAGRSIKQVAAGISHSLLLADDGTVFSFGDNTFGQTGRGFAAWPPTYIATPIDTVNLGGRLIKQVAAGGLHSLLLADDGTVFSFGSNRYGRTGLGTEDGTTVVATAIDTTNLEGRSIKQVAAGRNHNLLLADDGTVFSFGQNWGGETGLGTEDGNTLIATPIDTTNLGGRAITQVAAGYFHSLLLADDGTVFSFGLNAVGLTGLGTTDGNALIATPIDTTNLADLRVIDISAGAVHSLLVAVPEPGSLALLLFVTPLLWLRRR